MNAIIILITILLNIIIANVINLLDLVIKIVIISYELGYDNINELNYSKMIKQIITMFFINCLF